MDPLTGWIDREGDVESLAPRGQPLTYVVAFAGGGAKDVTSRCVTTRLAGLLRMAGLLRRCLAVMRCCNVWSMRLRMMFAYVCSASTAKFVGTCLGMAWLKVGGLC